MEVGSRIDDRTVLEMIGANELPPSHSVETDYALAYTRNLASAPQVGTRAIGRLVIGSGGPNFAEWRVSTDKPGGIWVWEVWSEFDSDYLLSREDLWGGGAVTSLNTSMSLLRVVGPSFLSGGGAGALDSDVTLEAPNLGSVLLSTGTARVLGGRSLTDQTGGPVWIPPSSAGSTTNRFWFYGGRIAAASPWTGTIVLAW